MTRWWKFKVLLLVLLPLFSLHGQEMLTEDRFFEWIKETHPVVRQSDLLLQSASAYLQKARGGFDPKLEGELAQKYFDQKNYYLLAQGELKIPTWYGLELKGSMNWADGVYLNPENKLPANGQATLGIRANLMQGLLIDERRAELQKARIMEKANVRAGAQMVNDLLMDANLTYWDWVYTFNVVEIYEEALTIAENRLVAVREQYLQGDKPAVDTLESQILVKQRRLELNDARLAYQNAGLALANFLWQANGTPFTAMSTLRPPALDTTQRTNRPLATWQAGLTQHPELEKYRFKLNELAVDQRFRRDQLRPKLSVEYNLLANGLNFADAGSNAGLIDNLLTNNYKWGATFSYPIFQRKARGEMALNRIKIEDTQYQLNLKQQSLQQKLESYYNQLATIDQQLILQTDIVEDRTVLLAVENEKFRIGESSIFLINAREQKLIEDRIKLEKLKAAFQKTQTGLRWVNGTLWE